MDAIEQVKSEYQKLIDDFRVLEQAFQASAQETMRSVFTRIFESNPEVEALRWTQYTPYFNDGDECIFGVHDFYFRTKDTPKDAGDNGDGFDSTYFWSPDKRKTDPYPQTRAVVKNFADAISQLPETVFKATFGDHVRVTATKDGFDVEEYEHE